MDEFPTREAGLSRTIHGPRIATSESTVAKDIGLPGSKRFLPKSVRPATVHAGDRAPDLGPGAGNLKAPLLARNQHVWGARISEKMLIEATEEAIYDSLFAAEAMTGRDWRAVDVLPLDHVLPFPRSSRSPR